VGIPSVQRVDTDVVHSSLMVKTVILWYYATVYSLDRNSATKRFISRSPPQDAIRAALESLSRALPSDLTLPDGDLPIPSRVATRVCSGEQKAGLIEGY